MLAKGDKIILTKPMGMFDNIGEICEVTDVKDNVVAFAFGDGMHLGYMTMDEYPKYFELYKDSSPKLGASMENVHEMIENSQVITRTVFDRCTIVAVKLPNEYVMVESYTCANPQDFDEDLGIQICLERIRDRLLEMETYMLQWEDYEDGQDNRRLDDCDDEYCEDESGGYQDVCACGRRANKPRRNFQRRLGAR